MVMLVARCTFIYDTGVHLLTPPHPPTAGNRALVRLIKWISALTAAAESLRDHNFECLTRKLLTQALVLSAGHVDMQRLNALCGHGCRRCKTLTDRLVRLHATPTRGAPVQTAEDCCVVCLDPVGSRDQRWQCSVCRVSLHLDCYASCVRAGLSRQASDCARCPHCRASGPASRYPPPLHGAEEQGVEQVSVFPDPSVAHPLNE